MNRRINLIGAGPTGALLAVLLKRRGMEVTLYESRADPRATPGTAGRSINLALAERGIHALKVAGVFESIVGMMMPMRGRFVHPRNGAGSLQPYGRQDDEVIHSISRHRLNQALLDVAIQEHGIDVRFEHRVEGIDCGQGTASIRNLREGTSFSVALDPLVAADGAGSVLRRGLSAAGIVEARESELDHGYKELSIPGPAPHGGRATPPHALASDALHIWPRGDYMLIALPNADGSFTATLFLPKHGAVSFDALQGPAAIDRFLSTNFADVRAAMPDCVEQFQAHPTGLLGTVHAQPWAAHGTLLIGDAAHAIVPFHGQGMNCCFEDCVVFDRCLARHADWHRACTEFFQLRKADTDAIAAMALENYLEMRERVVDPKFLLQQAVARELEQRFPQRFIPRYSMVTFRHDIAYRTAFERGKIQSRLLSELTRQADGLNDVDFERARREIFLSLPVLPAAAPAR